MDLQEIDPHLRCLYVELCPKCKEIQHILTKRSNDPEYETEIYLRCQCGNYIKFILPVN